MSSSRALILVIACVLLPRVADAQWYVAGYLGINHTLSSTVSIEQPALGTSLEFNDVAFEARPFESPQYYGVRVGRLFGESRRFGVEFEWLHPKVYADTSAAVRVAGQLANTPVDTTIRMDTVVQRYSMSHGMNFALINAVMRLPISPDGDSFASRVAITGRAGAGPMVPHGESEIGGQIAEKYEVAGIGYQLAGGVDVRIAGHMSALVDYKFGHASPEITVASGTGQTTANVHQLAFGLAFGFTR